MSHRYKFEIECPNNHNQTVSFTREEYDERQKSGGIVFHCNTCDTNWAPTAEEMAKFRKEFAKDGS